jgi:hypothetical protein
VVANGGRVATGCAQSRGATLSGGGDRADAARRLAAEILDPGSRRKMLQIAESYERAWRESGHRFTARDSFHDENRLCWAGHELRALFTARSPYRIRFAGVSWYKLFHSSAPAADRARESPRGASRKLASPTKGRQLVRGETLLVPRRSYGCGARECGEARRSFSVRSALEGEPLRLLCPEGIGDDPSIGQVFAQRREVAVQYR